MTVPSSRCHNRGGSSPLLASTARIQYGQGNLYGREKEPEFTGDQDPPRLHLVGAQMPSSLQSMREGAAISKHVRNSEVNSDSLRYHTICMLFAITSIVSRRDRSEWSIKTLISVHASSIIPGAGSYETRLDEVKSKMTKQALSSSPLT